MEYKGKIVVVDEDELQGDILRVIFSRIGYETEVWNNSAYILHRTIDSDVHLVTLEDLPGIDCFSIFRELKARGYRGPIIFLTRRNTLEDRLKGWNLGCMYFLTKPFEPVELALIVENILRHFNHHDINSMASEIYAGDAVLSLSKMTFFSRHLPEGVILTPLEMRLLELLMRNAEIVLKLDTLVERVWGYEFQGDENRVFVNIRRLRKKIEPNPRAPRFIQTVKGLGYVFRSGNWSEEEC